MPAVPTPANGPPTALPAPNGSGNGWSLAEPGFVGRRAELRTVHAAIEQADAGRGVLVLVSGEAGVGKTRLVDAVTSAVRDTAVVAWGRCPDGEGAPPYWPWRQILRTLVASTDPPVRLEHDLPPLVRELTGGSDPTPPTDRFRLFEGVRQILSASSAERPNVLVLDDLHLADEGSLALLHFVARELRGLRVLILGTYRPLEAKRQPEVDRAIATAAREGRRVALRGLDEDEVAELLAAATGEVPSGRLVRRVTELTGGNPLLVLGLAAGELDVSDGDAALCVPEELRALLLQQLEVLPPTFRALLTTAAVGGPAIDVERMGLLEGRPVHQILEAMGAGVGAGLLVEDSERTGRFHFRNALLRETLIAELEPAQRAELHRRIAQVIEEHHAEDLDPHLDDLALHRARAAPIDPDGALDALALAAARADRLHDTERAAAHYRTALDLAERSSVPRRRRVELLCGLGGVLERSGATDAARGVQLEAVDLARGDPDPIGFVRAVLSSSGGDPTPATAGTDPTRLPLLREALERLGDRDDALRALLLSQLAVEQHTDAPASERDELTQEAVALARRTGDDGLVGRVLVARHHALWSLDDIEDRLANATELLRVATASGDTELALQAHTWRLTAFLELADPLGVDREIAVHARLADQSGAARHRWQALVFRAMRAMLHGRYTDAERHATQALRLGRLLDTEREVADAELVHGIQLFSIRKAQGRLLELNEAVALNARTNATEPVWRAALAYVQLTEGRAADAGAVLDELSPGRFAQVPVDGSWLIAISLLAEIAAFLGDERHARTLYDLLLPYADRTVVVAEGAGCRGAVAHYLGLLATAFTDQDTALQHLGTAIDMHDRLGARRYAVKSRLACAAALQAAGRSPQRTEALLLEALDIASLMGIREQIEAARTALRTARGEGEHAPVDQADAERPPASQQAGFVRHDDRWIITFDGVETHLRDAKGLRYLSRLLANPDAEQHALALEQGTGARDGALDRRAAAAARERFEELESAIEEAESYGDDERAALMRERMHDLATDLATAAGLGDPGDGRAERARLNVTRALRTALRNIEEAHPALGRHLASTIRTGMMCIYRPDPRAPLSWQVRGGTGPDA